MSDGDLEDEVRAAVQAHLERHEERLKELETRLADQRQAAVLAALEGRSNLKPQEEGSGQVSLGSRIKRLVARTGRGRVRPIERDEQVVGEGAEVGGDEPDQCGSESGRGLRRNREEWEVLRRIRRERRPHGD